MTVELDLGEQVTISNVHDCHLAWRTAMNAVGDVIIDASRLASVDTAGLQLLLVLKHSLAAASRRIEWHMPSAELLEVARLVGLDAPLELADD